MGEVVIMVEFSDEREIVGEFLQRHILAVGTAVWTDDPALKPSLRLCATSTTVPSGEGSYPSQPTLRAILAWASRSHAVPYTLSTVPLPLAPERAGLPAALSSSGGCCSFCAKLCDPVGSVGSICNGC